MFTFFDFDPDAPQFVADYETAWKIVASQLEMDNNQRVNIKEAIRQRFNRGIKEIYRDVKPFFIEKEWGWRNLDAYIAHFRTRPYMPYMLEWAASYHDIPQNPDMDTALSWFTVAELKGFCKTHGLSATGKREDIENTIRSEGSFLAAWSGEIAQRRREKEEKKSLSDKRKRAEILIHYVVFLCGAQGRIRDIKKAFARNPEAVVVFMDCHDEGERDFYKNITAIDEMYYPPFFPGDRVITMIFRNREKVPAGRRILQTPWK